MPSGAICMRMKFVYVFFGKGHGSAEIFSLRTHKFVAHQFCELQRDDLLLDDDSERASPLGIHAG